MKDTKETMAEIAVETAAYMEAHQDADQVGALVFTRAGGEGSVLVKLSCSPITFAETLVSVLAEDEALRTAVLLCLATSLTEEVATETVN